MIEAIWIVLALVIVATLVFTSRGKAPVSPERPPFLSNPAERAGQPVSPAVATLDRNIRTWLDRDDIATWIAVAREAGLQVPDLPQRAMPANPPSIDEE
jgi:hypothetical protein